MRETWAVAPPPSPLSAPPLFRFLAGLQTTATPSHLWIYFLYDGRVYVLARLPYWRLRVEVLRANAYARTRGYRLTHYVVAITCIFRGSLITFADSRIHARNVNTSARTVLGYDSISHNKRNMRKDAYKTRSRKWLLFTVSSYAFYSVSLGENCGNLKLRPSK